LTNPKQMRCFWTLCSRSAIQSWVKFLAEDKRCWPISVPSTNHGHMWTLDYSSVSPRSTVFTLAAQESISTGATACGLVDNVVMLWLIYSSWWCYASLRGGGRRAALITGRLSSDGRLCHPARYRATATQPAHRSAAPALSFCSPHAITLFHWRRTNVCLPSILHPSICMSARLSISVAVSLFF